MKLVSALVYYYIITPHFNMSYGKYSIKTYFYRQNGFP